MYHCVVCGKEQSVTYGSESSQGFNQKLEKELWLLLVSKVKKHKNVVMNINITEEKVWDRDEREFVGSIRGIWRIFLWRTDYISI